MSLLDFDEVNRLASDIYRSLVHSSHRYDQGEGSSTVEDSLLDLLIMAYVFGYDDTNNQLGEYAKPDVNQMKKTIYQKYDGIDFVERARLHLVDEDEDGFLRLAENEYHRVFCDAQNNCSLDIAKYSADPIDKRWNTQLDKRVRDTHAYLQSMTVPVGSDFYTYDGDHAPSPGGFSDPENNIGCRCYLTFHRQGSL